MKKPAQQLDILLFVVSIQYIADCGEKQHLLRRSKPIPQCLVMQYTAAPDTGPSLADSAVGDATSLALLYATK